MTLQKDVCATICPRGTVSISFTSVRKLTAFDSPSHTYLLAPLRLYSQNSTARALSTGAILGIAIGSAIGAVWIGWLLWANITGNYGDEVTVLHNIAPSRLEENRRIFGNRENRDPGYSGFGWKGRTKTTE